jgi:outer membrane protein OmpA-like peptidoglycan-associated protein
MMKSNDYRRYFVFVAALLLVFQAMLSAQESSKAPTESARSLVRLGFWGHGSAQQHSSRFLWLRDKQEFTEQEVLRPLSLGLASNPVGWNAGVLAEFPLADFGNGASLGIATRLGISAFSVTFLGRSEPTRIERTDTPEPIEYTIAPNLLALTAEPLLTLRLADNRLSIMAGAHISRVIRERTTIQRAFPATSTILPEIRAQIEASEAATVGTPVIVPSIMGGLSWEIPLTANGSLLLVPEVFYVVGLQNIANNLDNGDAAASWRINALRAGLSLKFAPEKPPLLSPPPPALPQPEAPLAKNEPTKAAPTPAMTRVTQTITPPTSPKNEASSLRVNIASVVGVKRNGQGMDYPAISAEEFLASSSRYLLPYIFFDEKSAAIPQRYVRLRRSDTPDFLPENLVKTASPKTDHELDVYYQLLNIIGFRLQQYPFARLTITGFNDANAEITDGKIIAGKPLGLQRAERIKEYLQTVWDIPASRILARSGGTRGTADAVDAAESRMVEMQASQAEIFEELRYDYILRQLEPPVVEIQPEIIAPKGLAAWSATITQDVHPSGSATKSASAAVPRPKNLFAEYLGKVAPTTLSSNLERATAAFPLLDDDLTITVSAADKERNSSQASVKLPIKTLRLETKRQMNLPDVRVGTYWVFCFDLNSKQILVDERIRRVVQSLKKNITPGAELSITGYADTRGNVQSNRRLSDERAEAVSQLINAPSSRVASIEGKGESVFYDNDLPEGRFYNRFVRVDVRTPIAPKR